MKFLKPPYTISLLLFLCLAAYFPVFLHLTNLPIRLWDESRLAINAIDMCHDGDWITTHFDGRPDLWNTKPPLMIWLQVISIKAFGVNELSIRLPAALAAIFTLLLLYFLCNKVFHNTLPGFFSALVLVSSAGYIRIHGTRTGDYDSLVTLFITLYVLAFFLWTETGKRKHLLLFFAALALAILTKGVTGLLMLPALAIYIFYSRKLGVSLKEPVTWAGLILLLVTAGGYYLLREHFDPAYLKMVSQNELGHRYFGSIDGHSRPLLFYAKEQFNNANLYWTLFFLVAVIVIPKGSKTVQGRLAVFLLLLISSFMLIITFSQTKLEWYDLPVYPLKALFIGMFISGLLKWFYEKYAIESDNKRLAIFTLTVLLFLLLPYTYVISKVYKPKERPFEVPTYEGSYYMRDLLRSDKDLSNIYLIRNITLDSFATPVHDYDAQREFYLYVKGKNDRYLNSKTKEQLVPGDVAIICSDTIRDYIEKKFIFDVVYSDRWMAVYRMRAVKGEMK